MIGFPPGWMIEVAAVALPPDNADPERDVAVGMARLLRGLVDQVGRSGMSVLSTGELSALAEVLDPWPGTPDTGGAYGGPGPVRELCTRCRLLGGHRDDCPVLDELEFGECGGHP